MRTLLQQLFLCISVLGACFGGAFLAMGLFENRAAGTFIFAANTLMVFGVISVVIAVFSFYKSN